MGCNCNALLAQEFVGWGIHERSKHTRQLQVCTQSKLVICGGDEGGGAGGGVADGSRSKGVPEMGVKVFRAQLDELVKDVRAGCLGPYQAHCSTVEFQKRGLPHVHLLKWTDETRAARDARIDSIVTAEASCESDVVFSLQLDKW